MSEKFGSKYPIQKSAVGEYLQHGLADMLFQYTIANYELPPMSEEEFKYCGRMFEQNPPNMQKEIFANEKVAKRFVRELEQNFVYNGRDSFSYTCRTAAENGVFYYGDGRKKHDAEQNKLMLRIFNPLLDKLANDVALDIESNLEGLRSQSHNEEIALMEHLAKKHGRKFK